MFGLSLATINLMISTHYAKGFNGLETRTIDGNDFFTCYNTIQEVIEKIRKERRPFLVHAKVPLLGHHTSGVRMEWYRDDLEEHKNLDTEGILDLILSKLYELYNDGKYYSIKWILEGNGLKLSGRSEDWDYGRMLEERGLIETMNGREVNAKLKLEGKYAIEQARKSQVPDYSKISDSDEELKTLLKEVLAEVKRSGYGQQIIFDEFDELRNDIPHLSKKSFGQLLKSKLGDLVAAKAFDKTLASDIFKQFTDQIFPF